MNFKNWSNLKYLSIYTLVLLFHSTLLSGIVFQDLLLFRNPILYATLFLLGVTASFGDAKIRNLAFLFQMPLAMQGVFTAVFHSLMMINPSYYLFVTMVIYTSFFLLWHYFSFGEITPWQMWTTLVAGYICYEFHMFVYAGIRDILFSQFPTFILYTSLWFLLACCCAIQSRYGKATTLIITIALCIYASFRGFYLLDSKTRFRTFNGETERPFTLALETKDEQPVANLLNGMNVCLILRNNNPEDIRSLETLQDKYAEHGVSFIIIGIPATDFTKEDIRKTYNSLHLKAPLYFASRKDAYKYAMTTYEFGNYLCMVENNMLKYVVKVSEVKQAGHFLNKAMNL